MKFAKFICAAVLTFSSTAAFAADAPVRVLVPAYTQAAVTTLKPMIEAKTGLTLALEAATTDVILERLAKGDAGDLVVTSKSSLAPAEVQARVQAPRDVAVSTVGIGVADGVPAPKLATPQDVAEFLKATPSFAYSTAQSGRHMASVIEKLGLTEVMKPKTQTGAGLMGARIVKGEVAAVGQQISELRLAGVKNIVPLPDALQLQIVVAAAAVKGSNRAGDVEKIVAILASPEAAKAYTEAGLRPLTK